MSAFLPVHLRDVNTKDFNRLERLFHNWCTLLAEADLLVRTGV